MRGWNVNVSFWMPDFKIKVTLTAFCMFGKIRISNDEFNISASGLFKTHDAPCTNFTETLKYPADVEHFHLLVSFSTVFRLLG